MDSLTDFLSFFFFALLFVGIPVLFCFSLYFTFFHFSFLSWLVVQLCGIPISFLLFWVILDEN